MMGRNIELKAWCPDLEAAHAAARSLGAIPDAGERQCDTYFTVPRGKLKLRRRWRCRLQPAKAAPVPEPADSALPAQLIWYQRADEARPRGSDYSLLPVPDADALRALLEGSLGVAAEVVKERRVYMHDQVRIHLDAVHGLGSFIEFEAIVDRACDDAAAHAKLDRLCAAFRIRPDQLLQQSYAELLHGHGELFQVQNGR